MQVYQNLRGQHKYILVCLYTSAVDTDVLPYLFLQDYVMESTRKKQRRRWPATYERSFGTKSRFPQKKRNGLRWLKHTKQNLKLFKWIWIGRIREINCICNIGSLPVHVLCCFLNQFLTFCLLVRVRLGTLKLNAKKCKVLRIGPLKSKHIEFMKHRKFSWNSNEASCLRMVFKINKENVLSSNLEPKLKEF